MLHYLPLFVIGIYLSISLGYVKREEMLQVVHLLNAIILEIHNDYAFKLYFKISTYDKSYCMA